MSHCPRTAPVHAQNDDHVTVQIHLPLLTAALVFQREPGIVAVVWANIVIAAEPVIQHAYTPKEFLVLEIIEEVNSSHRLATVANRIVSTTRSKTTTTRHRDANTLAAKAAESGPSADEEHKGTTAAVATMVQPFKGTVNEVTEGSATGAVNTKIPLYFPLETGSAKSIFIKQECPPLCR